MDHDHGGAGHDMPMAKCSMNMIWNTQIEGTCIVFESWRISSKASFVFSFFVIVAIGVFYEWLRSYQRAFDAHLLATEAKGKFRLSDSRDGSRERGENAGLLGSGKDSVNLSTVPKAMRAVLYAATIFISFFLMLVFMTYNAYLILAVVVGAGVGHFIFAELSASGDSKGMACH